MAIINAEDDSKNSTQSFIGEETSVPTTSDEGHPDKDRKPPKDSTTGEEITIEAAPAASKARLSVSYEAPKSSKHKVPVAAENGEEIRAYKKTRLLGSFNEVITLIVGGDGAPRSFIVHQKVLCAASPFFESACKPEWMTTEDRVIKLPEDDPDAIEMMLFWMYHNTIGGPHKLLCIKRVCTTSDMNNGIGLFAKLYVLGEKYQMPELRNDAVDAIYLWSEQGGEIPVKVISYIWENTLANSRIRALLVKLVKREFSYTGLERMKDEVGSDFWCSMTLDYYLDKECRQDMMDEDFDYGHDHEYDEFHWEESFCEEFHTHSSVNYTDHQRKEYDIFTKDDYD